MCAPDTQINAVFLFFRNVGYFEFTASQWEGFVFTQAGVWPGSIALIYCVTSSFSHNPRVVVDHWKTAPVSDWLLRRDVELHFSQSWAGFNFFAQIFMDKFYSNERENMHFHWITWFGLNAA